MDNRNRNGGDAVSCGVLLIGIGILCLRHDIEFWPHILLVFAIAGTVGDLVKGELIKSTISLVLWGGIYAWYTGYLTGDPAVLLPLGVILIGGLLLLSTLRWNRPRATHKARKTHQRVNYDYELAEDW